MAANLRAGGRFLVTTTNADWLIKKLLTLPEHELGTRDPSIVIVAKHVLFTWKIIYIEFGNQYYSVRFERRHDTHVFGRKITFRLEGAVEDCDESLVHAPTLHRYLFFLYSN